MNDVVAAKVRQAISLLEEFDLPVWIVQFARESYDHPQPVQRLAVGTSVTWPAAFLVARSGETIAIAGTGDVANIEATGAYAEVRGYVQDIAPDLCGVLTRLDPTRIGLSYSIDDDSADNLSHGMYLLLESILRDTPYAGRLVPADALLSALRSRKLPVEEDRIRAAISTTHELFSLAASACRPGVTEQEVAAIVHERISALQLAPAWDPPYCPVVNFGPDSPFGHAAPGQIALQPGMLIHIDLGVSQNGYCSDLQRVWYMRAPRERHPPAEIRAAFDLLRRSLEAGFGALRPGVPGWQVDRAARQVLVDAGEHEPAFALGHQLGQSTHDGGCLLGPCWPRYGTRPEMLVEEGNVFTLEFALRTGAGTIGLEEDVVVRASGAEYLGAPQEELWMIEP